MSFGEPDALENRRRPVLVLLVASLGVFIVFLDTTIVNVAFETISRSFHTTTVDDRRWSRSSSVPNARPHAATSQDPRALHE